MMYRSAVFAYRLESIRTRDAAPGYQHQAQPRGGAWRGSRTRSRGAAAPDAPARVTAGRILSPTTCPGACGRARTRRRVGESWWVGASHGVSPSVPPGLCEDRHLFACPAERGEQGRAGGARGGFRGARRVEGKNTVQLYLPASPALLAHATATPAGEIIQPDLAAKARAHDLFFTRLVHHQVAVTSEPTPLPSPLPSPNQPEASSPLTNPTPCAVREGLSARMEQRVLANLGQLPWGGPPSPPTTPK